MRVETFVVYIKGSPNLKRTDRGPLLCLPTTLGSLSAFPYVSCNCKGSCSIFSVVRGSAVANLLPELLRETRISVGTLRSLVLVFTHSFLRQSAAGRAGDLRTHI